MRRRDMLARGLRDFWRFCVAVLRMPLRMMRWSLRCIVYAAAFVLTMPFVVLGVMEPPAPFRQPRKPGDGRR